MGVTQRLPPLAEPRDGLMALADTALYQARENGRNRVKFADGANAPGGLTREWQGERRSTP